LGWFYMTSAIGTGASRVLFGKVVDRRGPDIVLIPALAFYAICILLISFSTSTGYLIVLGIPYGLANGAIGPPLNSLMFNRCSPNRRGTVFAAYAMAMDVGISVGAPALGLVADYISFDSVYWLSSALLGVALLIYIFHVSDRCYKRRQQ